MALYAFDGTWNSDKPGSDQDTNVLHFRTAYQGPAVYLAGVGTRFGMLGRIVGGMSGAGGRTRVEEMFEQLVHNVESGDTTIDVVGFSRGAALALHFVNRIEATRELPDVRFLGLWDCVPSFGVASIDANIGWDLDLPTIVTRCYHALALDECRHTFHVHRLNAQVADAHQDGRLFEVWFRGVHSDIGGGNANPGLSSIALNWMFAKAKACGLPIDETKVAWNRGRMKPECDCSDAPWYDLVRNRRRVVRWNDLVHYSVKCKNDDARYNEPPVNACVVDDAGVEVCRFTR